MDGKVRLPDGNGKDETDATTAAAAVGINEMSSSSSLKSYRRDLVSF